MRLLCMHGRVSNKQVSSHFKLVFTNILYLSIKINSIYKVSKSINWQKIVNIATVKFSIIQAHKNKIFTKEWFHLSILKFIN